MKIEAQEVELSHEQERAIPHILGWGWPIVGYRFDEKRDELFLACGISGSIKREEPASYPLKLGR